MLDNTVALVLSAFASVGLFALIGWVVFRCAFAPRRVEHVFAVSPRTLQALVKRQV